LIKRFVSGRPGGACVRGGLRIAVFTSLAIIGVSMDLSLAREMMAFGADLLKYCCPDDLPEMRVEPGLECLGQIRWSLLRPPVIALRHWGEGNLKVRATLARELMHWTQYENGVEMKSNDFYKLDQTVIEAVTVQSDGFGRRRKRCRSPVRSCDLQDDRRQRVRKAWMVLTTPETPDVPLMLSGFPRQISQSGLCRAPNAM
jgi:hypothetical protein